MDWALPPAARHPSVGYRVIASLAGSRAARGPWTTDDHDPQGWRQAVRTLAPTTGSLPGDVPMVRRRPDRIPKVGRLRWRPNSFACGLSVA